MDLSTNIIRNVYNIGTNFCDAGTQYCTEDYSLYFPCLKNITKGQNVCFDFYVADGNTQDVVDLRTVDSISLNLNGQFNCSYGTFSYPDNIKSLQREDYSKVYSLLFEDRVLCHLSLFKIDTENPDAEIYDNTLESDFYSGTLVEVAAYDTPTHIFMGWAKLNINEEYCADETWEDNIFEKANTYKFTITEEEVILIAIYRPRKRFNIISDSTNKSSYFSVDYNHIEYFISNRDEENFDDEFDVLEDVLEGYQMVITCKPSTDRIDSDSDSENGSSYKFTRWSDGSTSRCRLFKVGYNTKKFEEGNIIKLKAYCSGPFEGYTEPEPDTIIYNDKFDEEGIHIRTDFSEVDIYDYYDNNEYVKSSEEVYKKYINEDGYLFFNSGKLVLSSQDIEGGIKIDIHASADASTSDSEYDFCELEVKVNNFVVKQSITDFKRYEFYFTKCNKSDIEISTDGNCLIDEIIVYKEVIIDGGKAQFCLDAETTSNIPSGPLSVNGAIAVGELGVDENGELTVNDPQAYGLTTTVIGNVNRIPKITIKS